MSNRYYDELTSYDREGFFVIVDKTWEEVALRDCFDDSCYDIKEMEEQVNSGVLDWFMLRVRVLLDGHELGRSYLGGCLYGDPKNVLTDGTAEDIIEEALIEARSEVRRLKERLNALEVQ